MGLIYERSPLGEIKEEKKKKKGGEGGAMGPRAHESGATPTMAGAPLAYGISPILLMEGS